ncbi:MAG: hypothetical protein M5U23_02520 [Acidimicrobiia bacterium]|nr:hypothetical protein [Acidimicrobiia bacterium]
MAKLVLSKRREYVRAEVGLVAGQGLRFEMGLRKTPPFGPFGDRGLGES